MAELYLYHLDRYQGDSEKAEVVAQSKKTPEQYLIIV